KNPSVHIIFLVLFSPLLIHLFLGIGLAFHMQSTTPDADYSKHKDKIIPVSKGNPGSGLSYC
ncbi:MAG: hypothetical protein ACC651_14345, partial [Candidatus Scalindua sp.]